MAKEDYEEICRLRKLNGKMQSQIDKLKRESRELRAMCKALLESFPEPETVEAEPSESEVISANYQFNQFGAK
jgi:hypothetical protein